LHTDYEEMMPVYKFTSKAMIDVITEVEADSAQDALDIANERILYINKFPDDYWVQRDDGGVVYRSYVDYVIEEVDQ
jgi:predicted RNA-binding protein with PUA domain